MNAKHFALAMLIGLLSFTSVHAGDDDNSMLKHTVKQAIEYPEFAIEKDLEGTVWVEFTISEKGKINIEKLNSVCAPLREYVAEKLQGMDASGFVDEPQESYRMYFDFYLL